MPADRQSTRPPRPPANWLQVPVVAQHIERAARSVADSAAQNFSDQCRYRFDETPLTEGAFDSPLEAIFQVWWDSCVAINPREGNRFELFSQEDVTVAGQRFRLDFVVGLVDQVLAPRLMKYQVAWPGIAVEVDGHAFHERTPMQVARRDARDRLLQQAGWTVFHYSWSEFTTDPEPCISEVFCYARDKYHELNGYCARLQQADRTCPVDETR